MPGGRIAPDGRAPQAKGVGKNSRRHDLEQPKTPGLHGSDLQQGDVQRLEAAQRVAPTPKRTQPAAQPQRRAAPAQGRPQQQGGMQVPDALEFAKKRAGGQPFTPNQGPTRQMDTAPWIPLMEQLAYAPNSGGALTANLMNILSMYRRQPIVSNAFFIDMDEVDDTIRRSL